MHKHLPLLLIVCGILLMAGSVLLGASNSVSVAEGTVEGLADQRSRSGWFTLSFYIGVMDVVAGFCLYWVRAGKKKSPSKEF